MDDDQYPRREPRVITQIAPDLFDFMARQSIAECRTVRDQARWLLEQKIREEQSRSQGTPTLPTIAGAA
jgi:hypothetical protein